MARTRTLDYIKMFPETVKEHSDVFDEEGKPVNLDSVYVSQWMGKESGRIEPKYGSNVKGQSSFGHKYGCRIYLHREQREPFLIIKTSLGGSSRSCRYRSPSSDKWTPPARHLD
jgi:hypothetical protein